MSGGGYAQDDGGGIISLVRETAEGLGRLIADHIKLARVEMVADAKTYTRHAALLGVALVVLLVGYVFCWLAAGLALARLIGLPLAMLAVGVLHAVVGAVVLSAARRRMAKTHVLDDTVNEASRTVATLSAGVSASRAPTVP
jgi:hypothetical protein